MMVVESHDHRDVFNIWTVGFVMLTILKDRNVSIKHCPFFT